MKGQQVARWGPWLAWVAILLSSAGCQTERLLVVTVQPGDVTGEIGSLEIGSLVVGTSPVYAPPKTIKPVGDAGTIDLPIEIGIYLRERSGILDLIVHGYAPGGALVAGGQGQFPLTGANVQRLSGMDIVLHSCAGSPPVDHRSVCDPAPSRPDGGDAGETGADRPPDAVDADNPDGGNDGDAGPGGDTSDGDAADTQDADDGGTDRQEAPPGYVDAGVDRTEDASDARTDLPDAEPPPRPCVVYCRATLAACAYLFANEQQCEAVCTASGLEPSDGTLGGALDCRVREAEKVSMDMSYAPIGCPNASLISLKCDGPACAIYCDIGRSVCGTELFTESCEDTCFDDFAFGDPGRDRTGNSLACRMDWLQDAVREGSLCANAAPTTTGPCQAP